MQALTAVVLGATGFIGNYLVDELIKDDAFDKVRLLVRKRIEINNPKVEVVDTDFSDAARFKKDLGFGDYIFCCIGTTMSKVKGDKELYRKIDFGIAIDAATYGAEADFSKYLLVSSVGANASSSNFYVRLKGEIEKAVEKLGFHALHIFRPSFLLGNREEFRMGESIAKSLMIGASFFMVGGLRKYRGIEGKTVAKAMVNAAKSNYIGTTIYEYDEIMKLASQG